MSERLRAEDVKEAVEWWYSDDDGLDGISINEAHRLSRLAAAARAWLTSQEQTPNYDALIGEVGLRLRRVNRGETLTPERVMTEMLNVFDAALVGFHPQEQTPDRDVVDPFVAETLYEEHIARNIEARGGMAQASDWDAWEELPDMGRDYWVGLAVAARLASKAALVGFHPQDEGNER